MEMVGEVETSIPKSLCVFPKSCALPRGGKGENLGEDQGEWM